MGKVKCKKGWRSVAILGKKQILSRKVINQRIDHIKRLFQWAVSEEIVPPSVYDRYRAVVRSEPFLMRRPQGEAKK